MRREKISITIPAFNEEQTLQDVCKNALSSISKITDSYELLLVDDGSIDKTGLIMDYLKKQNKHIVVIHHKKNKGFSGAMKTCYEKATGDLIFLGPADGQFDYREVKKFVKEIEDKDFIVAYRVVNYESFYRKINSFFFHLISRILYGIRLREFSSCIMYRKKVRDSIKITADPFSCLFLLELIYKSMRLKYKFGQVPIHFYKRKGGVQKGNNTKMIIRTMQEMFRFWIDIRLGKIKLAKKQA